MDMSAKNFGPTTTDKTIAKMKETVENYYTDLSRFASFDLREFFDYVKNMPYFMEPYDLGAQVLQRPKLTLARAFPVVACANKAILIASFCKLKGIPCGFVVSARTKNGTFSHVFNWVELGKRFFVDATYPQNVIFAEKSYPRRKIYA